MIDQLPRIVLPPTSDTTPITPPPASVNASSTPMAASVPLQPIPPVVPSPEKLIENPLENKAPEKKEEIKSEEQLLNQPNTKEVPQQNSEPAPHQTHPMPTPVATPVEVSSAKSVAPQNQSDQATGVAPVAATPIMPPTKSTNTVTPAQLQAQEKNLEKDLEKINQEENKLLGTMKDWLGWIQGAESKKQTIERELKELDHELQAVAPKPVAISQPVPQAQPVPPVPTGPSLAELETQLQAATSQLKTIGDQQKIEEKKAFDMYSAGGSNREGLMKEMERISALYQRPVAEIKTKISALQADIKSKMPTPAAAIPTPDMSPTSMPTTTPSGDDQPAQPIASVTQPGINSILEHLRTLEQAKSGVIKQLLIDLPQQGQQLSIQRPTEGNGILVLAGTEANYAFAYHFSDADLIRAGLGGDDIASLPTGTLSAAQIEHKT